MQRPVEIILPQTIHVLRDKPNQTIRTDAEEYTIYYRNVLLPYFAEDDVQIRCDYGRNYGDCWRIAEFPYDVDEFPLTVAVYDPYGCKKAEKTVTVRLEDKKRAETPFRLLCVGDSMTRSQVYIEHLVAKLHNVQAVGTRSYNGAVWHEGRGGWSFATYKNNPESPFLFPQGVDGAQYAGSAEFWARVADPQHDSYNYDGYRPYCIQNGEFYLQNGALYQKQAENDVFVREDPQLSLSFEKYMRRHPSLAPDAVSILMGANDLQLCGYEECARQVAAFAQNLREFVDLIRACSKTVPIVVNLPIIGGDAYSWGAKLGCRTTGKAYDFAMKNAAKAILALYDGREDERILICPMVAVIDPVYGFPRASHAVMRYSEAEEISCANWVHPAAGGYRQMGDALAAVVEALR